MTQVETDLDEASRSLALHHVDEEVLSDDVFPTTNEALVDGQPRAVRLTEEPVHLGDDRSPSATVAPARIGPVCLEEPVRLDRIVEHPVVLRVLSAEAVDPAAAPVRRGEPARTPATKPGGIRRALALDGLRGVAVVAVVIYHLFGELLPGGYLGVDIFFVLSGFLITSLLVREYGAAGRISLRRFWTRRVRRILPAAITVLVVTTAVAGLIGGDVAVQLWRQFAGSALFVNNWVQIASSESYFADTTPRVFMHYWSLAIEEQFYVLWPLLFLAMMWVFRTRPLRSRMWASASVAGGLALASTVAMGLLFQSGVDPSRVYFGSDTHAFGILAGAGLALVVTAPGTFEADSWPRILSPRVNAILGWMLAPPAFVGLMVLLFVLGDTAAATYHGGLFLVCVLTTIVVHNAVRETGPLPRLLRIRVLRWLGERSFSLYLWHWPLFVFTRELLRDAGDFWGSAWTIGAVAGVLTLVLSEASYRWIETPFRRLGLRGTLTSLGTASRRVVPVVAVVGTVVCCLLAGSALGSSPSKSQLETQLEQLAQMQEQANAKGQAAIRTERALPPGTHITAVGDSVMLASSQALFARFPGIYVDGEVSRHYSGAEPVLDALRANGQLRKYVVLGLGTNGQAFPGQLARIVRSLGPNRRLVLVVPYGHVDGIAQAAQQLLRWAPRQRNVYLAPWCQIADTHRGDLGPDGVHPIGPGLNEYADAVAQGLRQAVSGKRNPNITCPL